MSDSPEPPKRNYKWPWIVWGAVLLGIALAIVWVRLAVVKIESERDFSAPPASSVPR